MAKSKITSTLHISTVRVIILMFHNEHDERCWKRIYIYHGKLTVRKQQQSVGAYLSAHCALD